MLKVDNASWYFIEDKETHSLKLYNASMGKISKIFSPTTSEVIGLMKKETDANDYLEYRRLGLRPDAIAYLRCEHDLHQAIQRGNTVSETVLSRMILDMQETSGRVCFGTCRSLQNMPACATCYFHMNRLWKLCATTSCLIPEEALQQYLWEVNRLRASGKQKIEDEHCSKDETDPAGENSI